MRKFIQRFVRISTCHLPTHGSGPLYQWLLHFNRRAFRFSSGGYGYIAGPGGFWCLLPSVTAYRGIAYYLHWLHFSVCYLPKGA